MFDSKLFQILNTPVASPKISVIIIKSIWLIVMSAFIGISGNFLSNSVMFYVFFGLPFSIIIGCLGVEFLLGGIWAGSFIFLTRQKRRIVRKTVLWLIPLLFLVMLVTKLWIPYNNHW